MNKAITIILLLFLSVSTCYCEDVSLGSFVLEIPVKTNPTKNKDEKDRKGPRMPERVPITVFMMGDCVTVTCEYEAEGEAEVIDNMTGAVVAEEGGELSSGLTLVLPEYHEGMMEIRIHIGGKNYIGYF